MPAAIGRRFALFVDTEEEFDWGGPFRREAAVTAMAALPAAHGRFAEAGIAPIYLATYPIVDDDAAASILKRIVADGEGEVGTQLHPWVTPPFDEPISRPNSFAGNLPRALEAAKLATLTRRIERAIGRTPRIYRAGRYGVGPQTAGLLRDAGYVLDVSVRPGFNYAPEGGPDFTGSGWRPFRAGRLAALPLGVGFPGLLGGGLAARQLAAHPVVAGVLGRLGLFARVPLTPEGTEPAEAIRAIDWLLDRDTPILSFSFHSPSLKPGCTPYVRDMTDLLQFWRWWDRVLDHLARAGVPPIAAGALIDALTVPNRAGIG